MQESPDDQDPVRGRYRLGRASTLVVCALAGGLAASLAGDRSFLQGLLIAVVVGTCLGLLLVGTQWWFSRTRDLR